MGPLEAAQRNRDLQDGPARTAYTAQITAAHHRQPITTDDLVQVELKKHHVLPSLGEE
jgi:hypothetical protein